MFNKKKEIALQGELKSGAINIIGIGTEINGSLNTKGDIRIDGKIIGDVSSKAKVVIGISGEVLGNILAENAEISGLIKGELNIKEALFLTATAKVTGNIAANKLVIEQGAQITGYCQTGITHTKSIVKPNLNGEEEETTRREASA
jgi:cytoskeletal protein CcmA (bactofilin family)